MDSGYVFVDEVGRPLPPRRLSRSSSHLVKALGLPKARFHDVRHSYATAALKAGVPPQVVSQRLGHANVGVTLSLYAHVLPGDDRQAAETVAASILGAKAAV